jgi:voltage-gated potassium channel
MIGGQRMVAEMVRPEVVSFLDVMVRDKDATLRIEEVPVPAGSRWSGRRVGELELSRHRLLLLAVKAAGGGSYLYAPGAEHPLDGGETLIVLGEPERVRALRAEAAA